MTDTEPHPITLDPTTLNEEFVQETMGWMTSKSMENLKNILSEETHQTGTYAPEIIEAAQRILTNRQELVRTPTLGERLSQLFWQQVEIKLPAGGIRNFKSHAELRTAILDEHIPKETLIRLIRKKPAKARHREDAEWKPLQTYANSDSSLGMLFSPIRHCVIWGLIMGLWLGHNVFISYLYFSHIVPNYSSNTFPFSIHNDPSIFTFILYIVVASFLLEGRNKIRENIYNAAPFLAFIIIYYLSSNFYDINGWNEWSYQQFQSYLLEVFWIIGFIVNGAIFGGPLGAIIGTGIGYVRSIYWPKAPDAKPEGMRPYRIGLLYPAVFMLIAWPLTYLWLYPWFLSTFPATLSN